MAEAGGEDNGTASKGDRRPTDAARQDGVLSGLLAGVVIAFSSVFTSIGVAALAFPGELRPWLFTAVGAVIFSALVYLVVTALLSSYAGTISLPQPGPAVVLGLMAGSLAPVLTRHLGNADEAVAAIIAAIGTTTVLTGVMFYVLGRLRLGGLIRFIPYPVVGGVLAGLGWLQVKGAVSVLTGHRLSLDNLAALVGGDNGGRIAAGLAIGVVLLVAVRRVRHHLALPALLVASIAAFYAVSAALGVGVGALSAGGWLIGPFPNHPAWMPPNLATLTGLDWRLVLTELPTIGTVVLIAAISTLLAASGIELAVRRDLDLNRELRALGLANLLAGLGGGVPGFHASNDTLLAKEMHAARRLTGVTAAVVLAVVLFAGAPLLGYMPKPVLGGLLFYLGLTLLVEWIWAAWFRLPRGDYLIVLIILFVAGWFGYLQGLGIGIVAGIVLFVVNYSRLGVTKYAVSGARLRSNVDRSEPERRVLDAMGPRIQVFALQGFIFFGSANKVLEHVRTRVDATGAEIEFVVVDFRLVNGLDTSSLLTLKKLEQLAEVRRFHLVVTTLALRWRQVLEEEGIGTAAGSPVLFFDDLDHGLEWCEAQLLAHAGCTAPADQTALPAELAEKLAPYLERVELAAGTDVMRQGEASDDMYFVRSGRVTVRLDGSQRLRTYGPGTVVGEIAMFLGRPRSATVTADAPTVLARLTRAELDRMAAEDPALAETLLRHLVTQMCERLANTNALVQSLL